MVDRELISSQVNLRHVDLRGQSISSLVGPKSSDEARQPGLCSD